MFSRRQFLAATAAASLGARTVTAAQPRSIGFGFSLYGMKSLSLNEALTTCADIGYSGVELAAMPDWPCDPLKLNSADRRNLRGKLTDLALDLPAVMENLPILATGKAAQDNLDRLKRAAELALDVAPAREVPLIETVLGGKPAEWESVKGQFVETLGRWTEIVAELKVPLAIKAHISNALQTPEQTVWLVRQIDSKYLKAAYDYSHFQRQGLGLVETVRTLLPVTIFVHVKDNILRDGKMEFALPGDAGNIDYTRLLQELRVGDYQGAVVVEVSGQVSSKPDYQPVSAAQRCYDNLKGAFHQTRQRANI